MKKQQKKKRRLRSYSQRQLDKVTGKWLKECYQWLIDHDCGCCHIPFDTSGTHEICVCVGWTDDGTEDGKVAWKIGWQTFNNGMQTDLDIDFDMPWNTEEYCEKMNAKLTPEERKRGDRYCVGDVYDTQEIIELKDGKTTPVGYRDWNSLAEFVRKMARKVAVFAKEVDPEEKED